ncbi:MAG: HD-GYP domain-containing protein [Planctomycetota bacterium]|jgi:putative nucleotidyltransferase with HDIG domain
MKDILHKYLPVDSSSLKTDTKIGCDLYLLVSFAPNSRYVLYCNEDAVFDNNKKAMLLEKNISRLFIKNDDKQKYYKYLESNFQNFISDTNLSSNEKTKIVYGAATNLVKDLFNDPRSGNVERAKTFAYNMVDYILKEGSAARSLLKIAVHEYYTYTHSVNVAAVGTLFAQELGFGDEDLKSFCSGILLHDIGKTRISTEILNKKGKLTKEEFARVKEHPELGVEILRETGNGFTDEYPITLQHHENCDGTGYPHGLQKNEIHRCGRIARIIDVYDALTTDRPYAKAIRPFAALVEMKEKMFNCFDTELFKEFIHFCGPYDPRKQQREGDKLQN